MAFNHLLLVLNRVFDLGVPGEADAKQIQITRLINKICVFVMALIIPYMLLTSYFDSHMATLAQLPGFFGLGLAIALNASGRFHLARVTTLFVGNFHVFVAVLIMGLSSGLYFYFFPAVFASFFFYRSFELKRILAFGTLTIALAVASQFLLLHMRPLADLPEPLLQFLHYFSLFGALGTVFVFVMYFYFESIKYERGLHMLNQELVEISETDPLTALPNRRKFEEIILPLWEKARREKGRVAVIMIDVDNFKKYNDHYGHQAGDHCLAEVARTIQSCIRKGTDFPARYGGEEFILLSRVKGVEEALTVAERIRERVQGLGIEHCKNKKHNQVTCSLGLASEIPGFRSIPAELIKNADLALYVAKRNGRNRTELHAEMF